MSNSLGRIADYFFVAGLRDQDLITKQNDDLYFQQQEQAITRNEITLLDQVQTVIDNFEKKGSFYQKKSTKKRKSEPKKQTVPNIFDVKYTPTVLMRYPKINTNSSFPAYAAMFCFPRDIQLYYGSSPPPERYHSFTMTDENGTTLYGTCIVFYEKLADKLKDPVNTILNHWIKSTMDPSTVEYAQHLKFKIETLLEQEKVDLYKDLLESVKMAICTANDVWVPKSIGLLGRLPWINLYSDWLKIVLQSTIGIGGYGSLESDLDVESAIINIIDKVPLPPAGRYEIGLTISSHSLFASRPPVNQVPNLKNFSLYPLFCALSPHLILTVIETLLSEGKVVFLSQYSGMLSIACESFRYMLFPFYWQFVYIPVLPEKLLTCLQAPVPYIIGFQGTMDELEEHAPDDVCIVHLDTNSIHSTHKPITLPDRQRRKLQIAFEQYAPLHTRCRIPYGVPSSIQLAFPNTKLILNSHISKSRESQSSVGSASLVNSIEPLSNFVVQDGSSPIQKSNFSTPMMDPTTQGSKNKLSTLIAKNMFNHDQLIPHHVKYVEGHMMTELLEQKYQDIQCVCGKQEYKDSLWYCQGCHLTIHCGCIDQIIHPCLPRCFDEHKIQEAIIRMFASLFHHYKSGFVHHWELSGASITVNDGKKNKKVFSKDKFLKNADKDTRDYLSNFMNSQMFAQFITDRILKPAKEPEILVFDEYIKSKLNRSKLKLVKEDTPFLKDPSFKITRIVWSTPPPPPKSRVKDYKRFPTNLHLSKHNSNHQPL